MPYTINNLIRDVLPRVAKVSDGVPNGISIWAAANSIQSLIYKNLIDRKSDLQSTNELFSIIPAYDYAIPLPDGFISMAEKPAAIEAPGWLVSSAWMCGTVVSFSGATLVVNVTAVNGSGTLAVWSMAVGWRAGQPIMTVDNSVSSVTVGLGNLTFTTALGFAFVPGQNVVISNVVLPTDNIARSRLDPEYLDDDDHDDYLWWEEYKLFGETWETATSRPRRFKVVGNTLYVRPKVIAPVMISGKYNGRPTPFVEGTLTSVIPWNGLFDEIFREGIVRIIAKGTTIPDADADFMLFFNREFHMVINARIRQVPDSNRTRRGNFM